MNRKISLKLLFALTATVLISIKAQAGYDPTIGRWLSRDPINNAEISQGPNLYTYVGNDPVNRIDLFGLDFIFLNNSSSVFGYGGHAATLVGTNATGWTYYSKNGVTNGIQSDTLRVFPTYQDFLNDPISGGYDRGVHFRTTLDQDLAMTTFGDAHLRDPYGFWSSNCGDFTSSIASFGGVNIPSNSALWVGPTRPNNQFWDLANQGIGKPFYQLHH